MSAARRPTFPSPIATLPARSSASTSISPAAYSQPIGVKPQFIDTQWSGVIPALYAGRFDMVPTMSYTKERLERVLFSIPYADASQALLIRAADKDKIKTIADMSGKVLGIKLGSPGETLKVQARAAAQGGARRRLQGREDLRRPSRRLPGAGAGQRRRRAQHGADPQRRPARQAGRLSRWFHNVGSNNWHGYAFRKEDTELAEFINGRITAMKAERRALRPAGQVVRLQDERSPTDPEFQLSPGRASHGHIPRSGRSDGVS